jgi:hypothetical protein
VAVVLVENQMVVKHQEPLIQVAVVVDKVERPQVAHNRVVRELS